MENLEHQGPVTPTRRPNFQYNGSDLYDSFEFRQMTQQLNKAIQTSNASSPAHHLNKAIRGSNASSPFYVFQLNSPFYQRQLNRIYRENSTPPPRRILGPRAPDKQACGIGTTEKGFVTRVWLKVKGLLKNKNESEGEKRL
ncbi:hypothetical protein RIF29_07934 [Crotalaria pallida]|uniref:Uncharacterized protein n=1 Tax=Crotalaria pallida TaxID=3830 RepID=A0AAN9J4U9_CROPI